jgi:NADPH:quinone reductase-like Zn-dependent oxidoreductase
MHRVVIRRPGGYSRLELEEGPGGEPSAGEVRVAVQSAGVNYADCVVRMGLYAAARDLGFPITPGFEFAGIVSAVGGGVSDLRSGDRVLGVTRFGGYATEVIAPRDQVFPLPAPRTEMEGAAFPVAFLTAWYALHELAAVRPGASVLVHSAAGGVGSALLQLGALAGGRMIGVVGAPHKVEVARACGAAVVIDKSREPLWSRARHESPRGFDAVLDANGAETLRQSYRHLAPAGRLVVYGFHGMLPRGRGRPSWLRLAVQYLRTPRFNPLEMTSTNRSVLAFNLAFLFDRRDLLARAMAELLPFFAEGRIGAPRIRIFPLERVGEAHRDLEAGATVGKLVLATGAVTKTVEAHRNTV